MEQNNFDPVVNYDLLKSNDLDLRIIPCYLKDGEMRPAIKWRKLRDWSQEEYEEWLKNYEWSESGYGFVLPNNVVGLDIDMKHGKNGVNNLVEHTDKYNLDTSPLEDAPKCSTPSGFHFYFRTKKHVTKSTGVLEGVDIQAGESGALLFAPPSEKESGTYDWADGRSIYTTPLPELPDWIVDLTEEDEQNREFHIETERDSNNLDPDSILSGVPKGERNNKLFRYSCRLLANNYDKSEAKVLVKTAATNCEPAYPSEGEESPEDMVDRVYEEYSEEDDEIRKLQIDTTDHIQEQIESATDLFSWVEERDRSQEDYPPDSLKTGIPQIDHLTNAFDPGEFVVISGAPKSGKTTLALQILSSATKEGNKGLFVSLEMDTKDILLKLAHCRLKHDMNHTIRGSHKNGAVDEIQYYLIQMAERMEQGNQNFYIATPSAPTVHDFCDLVNAYKQEHDIDFAMLDYFQFLKNPEPDVYSLNDYLSNASKIIRETALSVEIPIFTISRQNKAGTTYGTSACDYDMTTGIKVSGKNNSVKRYINIDQVRLAPGGTIEADLIGEQSRFANFKLEDQHV